mmetsp:Transcript_8036/g.11328  ORF Transcript_8036/g.11328 Transcript_8036/m.11328 type:complete len:241 (-) Transcript_8036:186-908(-)
MLSDSSMSNKSGWIMSSMPTGSGSMRDEAEELSVPSAKCGKSSSRCWNVSRSSMSMSRSSTTSVSFPDNENALADILSSWSSRSVLLASSSSSSSSLPPERRRFRLEGDLVAAAAERSSAARSALRAAELASSIMFVSAAALTARRSTFPSDFFTTSTTPAVPRHVRTLSSWLRRSSTTSCSCETCDLSCWTSACVAAPFADESARVLRLISHISSGLSLRKCLCAKDQPPLCASSFLNP